MIKSLLGRTKSYKGDVAICCIVKDEDQYFIEWMEYHIKIGVSRFFIYDNESTIPISTTLSEYIKRGIVLVEEIRGKAVQMQAYKHCLSKYKSKCGWIAFIDVDEFIVPKNLTGSLPEFLKAFKRYGGLGVYWLIFGSSGHTEKPSLPQINSFNKRSLKTFHMNVHIKTIVQTRYVKATSRDPHHFYFILGKYCVNENFERIKGAFGKHTSNKIQLNHYFLRSLDEFKFKIAKGRVDGVEDRKLEHFYEIDNAANLIIDESISELELLREENKH